MKLIKSLGVSELLALPVDELAAVVWAVLELKIELREFMALMVKSLSAGNIHRNQKSDLVIWSSAKTARMRSESCA
jgi:hypothetical protein